MAGIIAVYALVVAVLIAGNMKPPPAVDYPLFNAFLHLACGLSVGLTGLAAGYAIGEVGDTVRCTSTYSSDYGLANANATAGREGVYAAVEDIRRHGLDTDRRRGSRVIRVRTVNSNAAMG